MNFCVAILILKMEEKSNIFSILCFVISRKVKMQLKRTKRFGQCMEKVVWFVKFCAGDFSLDDAPWSSRQVEVDSHQTKTVIENNQRYTTWEIADIIKH